MSCKIKRKDIFVIELGELEFVSILNLLEQYSDCIIEGYEDVGQVEQIATHKKVHEKFNEAWKSSQELYEGVDNA